MSASGAGRTAWVCEACFNTHADRNPRDSGEDSGLPPLGLVGPDTAVLAGMLADEHECEDRWIGHRAVIGCGEEEREYDTAACEGCGSPDPGSRYALTFWTLGR